MNTSPTQSNWVVTASDHGALIVITALVGVTWTFLVFLIRLYIRLQLNGPFGTDDVAASFATAFGILHTGLILSAAKHGLGRQRNLLAPTDIQAALKLNYASNFACIVAICFSKCAMFLLIARLGQKGKHLLATYGIAAFTIAWAVISLFIMAFQCSLPEPWNIQSSGRCQPLFTRWVVVETFSILSEVCVSALSITLVWKLSMPFQTKVAVVCAFSAQLFVIIPIVFRLHFVRDSKNTTDATFDSTETAILTQIVMHFSIMAATFPCFRQFLQAFDSGLGATTKIGADLGSGSRTNSSYVLQSLNSARDGSRGKRFPGVLRPDSTAQIATAVGGRSSDRDADNMSIESLGSDQAIWTRRGWMVQYEARYRDE